MSGKIDLSSLPPEIRQKVEAGLAKLSPEARQQWEEKGSPLLARLVSGMAGEPALSRKPPPVPRPGRTPGYQKPDPPAPRPPTSNVSPPREYLPSPPTLNHRTPPWGHYNDTIAPGDRPGFVQKVLIAAAIAGAAAWLYF